MPPSPQGEGNTSSVSPLAGDGAIHLPLKGKAFRRAAAGGGRKLSERGTTMELVLERPSEKQRLFLNEKHKYVCFGGARGGGKSWAVRTKAVLLCCRYPGITVCIIRKTYPELRANHIRQLRKLLRCDSKTGRIAKYNDTEKSISFPNGSLILFRYLETEADEGRFQGTEVDVIFLDEATQHPEQRWDILKACLRGVNGYPKRIYLTCNPGGVGHGWVKRLFIDRCFKDTEDAEDYVFIQSLVTDNRALMERQPEYLRQLESLPPKQREAWLYGRWDIFEGQFFEELRTEPDLEQARKQGCELPAEELKRQRRWCHVIPPVDLTKGEARHWTILRSYDFGYGKPFSCAWWAVDYDGVLYRVLELYGCTGEPNVGLRWTPDEQFRRISEMEREHPWLRGKHIEGVADPAIWDASRGESVADTAARYGVWFSPGDNKRVPGWMQVHYRLQFDENGYARMYVFDTCRDFIRTMPLMVYDRHRAEDLDTELEDHIADETRYMCMSRPVGPVRKEEKKPELRWPDPLGR